MKKILFLVIFLSLFSALPSFAVSLEDVLDAERGITEGAAENILIANENFSFYDTVKNISGGTYSMDLKGILKKTLDMFFSEIRTNVKILSSVMLLGIVCTLISNLEKGFGNSGVTEASFLCCYGIIAGISAAGFSDVCDMVKNTIADMSLFAKSLVPVLTSMSIAQGKVITAPIMHTQILVGTSLCSIVTEKVIMPLTYCAFAVRFINNMTGSLSLSRFSALIDSVCKKIMSFMLLVFTATLALTGFAAGTAENMSMKTARLALSSFVPVAGGALADTVSALSASAGMIKNAAGIAGIIVVVLMSAYPVIKCAAMSFLYGIAGAVLEPVCDKRLSSAVTAIGECMGMLFALVSVSAAFYIISAAIMISAVAA